VTGDGLGAVLFIDAHTGAVPSLSHHTHGKPLSPPAQFLLSLYALGPPLPYPPGSARFLFLKIKMSYRNDTDATYDRTLLSSVPDPTRAEKQVRSPSPPKEIGYLSPSSPSPSLSPSVPRSPDLHSLLLSLPRLIGGLQCRFVR
jgi:hypothetical protein